MEQKPVRPRGRPPKFDRDAVVDSARKLFWKGGAAVPIDEVSRATGLHKPSLYSSFGGRRGIYLEALDGYLADSGRRMAEALSRAPLQSALKAFFDTDMEIFLGRDGERGCFLISTAIEASADDPEIRARVHQVLAGMRSKIRDRVLRARDHGDLRPGADPDTITDLVMSTHIALSVEARAGRSRSELQQKVDRLLALVAG
jgi:AcrR family transcriptional regulator